MIYVILIVCLAAIDLRWKAQIEKQNVEDFPRPLAHTREKIVLHRHHNAGFPFGFLQNYGALVRMIPLTLVAVLTAVLGALLPKNGKSLQKLSLSLMLGGALSNLYDRFVRRYVVDYFSFQFGILKKVIFNLGDLCVFLGAGIWLCIEFLSEKRQ